VAEGSVRARMDKCQYILSGAATEKDLRKAMILFLGFAALMGLAVVIFQMLTNGPASALAVAAYAFAGLFIGLQYSGAPMRLGYHGLGELVIGVVFGPLNMMGAAAAVTGAAFRPDMFILSIGIGCLVTNIVFVHSVMEAAADKQLGKRTFAHLLGGKTSQITALAVFTLVPFICLICNVFLYGWSRFRVIRGVVWSPPLRDFVTCEQHRPEAYGYSQYYQRGNHLATSILKPASARCRQ
jgi:1,4-dihydroxy-2-naphthoate octaprenyltransferase